MDKKNFSIIIPVYNDESGIKKTLNSLLNLSFERSNFEIIVADNGSTDKTRETIKKYIDNYPYLIKLMVEDKIKGSYAARNKGTINSKGEFLVFLDSNMTVKSDWLSRINKFIEEVNPEYFGYNVAIYSSGKENIFEKYDRLIAFPMKKFLKYKHFVGTGCLVVRRGVFEKIGLFNEKFISSGDCEFGNRVYNSGIKQYFDEKNIAYHPARKTFISLIKQAYRLGLGKSQLSSCSTKIFTLPIGLGEKREKNFVLSKIKNFTGKIAGWDNLKIYDKFYFFIIHSTLFITTQVAYIVNKITAN